MKNYKTKVNSKNESKEAQELFESLGYEKGACSLGDYPAVIVTTQDWATGNYCSTRALGLDIPAHENYTETNLAELRDMVVLKRNDVNDATHENNLFKYMELTDGWYYFEEKWVKSSGAKPEYFEKLKPIEKKMKEYLIPNRNYEYILTDAREGLEPHAKDWIEIPEWAEFAVLNGDNEINFYTGIGLEKNHFISDAVVWQRPTQPEALPFIDDEPMTMENQIKHSDKEMFDKIRNGDIKLDFSQFDQDDSEKGSTLITVPLIDDEPQSLNDQYAEIEQVRQHSHYKKDVSNLEFIDVYRVLKLFDVTDPCLQHAIKKLLCSGQRGAKSSDQDVQEAIDSLVRFQQMRIEDGLD